MIAAFIGHWMPVLLIVLIISFAFKDNPLWHFAETVAIGAGIGNAFVYEMGVFERVGITPALKGELLLFIPIICGLLLYSRFIPKYDWLSRYGFIWMVAGILGVGVGAMFQGTVLPGLIETMKITGPTMIDTAWKVLQLVIFLTTCSYFIFARAHTGILKTTSRIGKVFMLISLGIGYSALVEDTSYRVIERIWFVLDAIGLI